MVALPRSDPHRRPAALGPVRTGTGFALSGSVVLVAVIALGTLVAGLKLAGPAPDYRNYESQFLIDSITPFKFIWRGGDPLYHSLSRLLALGKGSFELFVLSLALATCALKASALARVEGNRLVLLALYASYLFWLHDYVQIRVALALALGLYGIYAETRFRYLFFLAATLVHISFAAVVVAYILIFVGTRRPVIAVAVAAAFTAVLATQDILAQALLRVNEYQDLTTKGRFNEINVFSLMPIVMLLSLGLALVNLARLREHYDEVILTGIGLAAFYALSATPVFAFRMMELFMPFYLVLMSRLWGQSTLAKLLCLAYAMVGLRAVFFATDPLIGGTMIQ